MEVLILLVALASLAVNVLVYRAVTATPPAIRREPTPVPDPGEPLLPNILGRPLSMTRAGIIIQKLRDGGDTE